MNKANWQTTICKYSEIRMLLSVFFYLVSAILLLNLNSFAGAQGIGVNYGTVADNLPAPAQAVDLCKSYNIQRIRIFNPNLDILSALQNSGIELILGVVNNDLPALGSDPEFAANWVQTNVVPYAATVNIRCIGVGNELIPSDLAGSVLPAMVGLRNALIAANIQIPVSTTVSQGVVNPSYPPSAGVWSPDVAAIMDPLAQFLQTNNYPLLYNAYPFFAYRSDPTHIRLDYALGNTTEVIVQDGSLGYTNLLDASVDALYWALEKSGAGNVEVVLSETGWPSDGDAMASINYAQTYNAYLVQRMLGNVGTPKRPGKGLERYIFALFNEDQKAAGSEQHFGLFYPDMTPVYRVHF